MERVQQTEAHAFAVPRTRDDVAQAQHFAGCLKRFQNGGSVHQRLHEIRIVSPFGHGTRCVEEIYHAETAADYLFFAVEAPTVIESAHYDGRPLPPVFRTAKRMAYYLALDLGAESGRAILGDLGPDARVLSTREIHRFANDPVDYGGSLHWDAPRLWFELRAALAAAGDVPLA